MHMKYLCRHFLFLPVATIGNVWNFCEKSTAGRRLELASYGGKFRIRRIIFLKILDWGPTHKQPSIPKKMQKRTRFRQWLGKNLTNVVRCRYGSLNQKKINVDISEKEKCRRQDSERRKCLGCLCKMQPASRLSPAMNNILVIGLAHPCTTIKL